MTRGLDGCLFVFSLNEWTEFEEKLRMFPLTDKNARKFVRFFLAEASSCELDRQGRVLVLQALKKFAGMTKEMVLTGMLSRIEIWSKEAWMENDSYGDMDDIAASMQELGINM